MAEVMPAEAAPVMMSMQQKLQQVAEAKAEDPAAASKEGPRAVTVRTPQIHWHGKSPVFAVDFHPHFGRLCATGGLEPDGTGGVHLWIVNDSTGESADKAPVSFVQDLQGHEKSVNFVCLKNPPPPGPHIPSRLRRRPFILLALLMSIHTFMFMQSITCVSNPSITLVSFSTSSRSLSLSLFLPRSISLVMCVFYKLCTGFVDVHLRVFVRGRVPQVCVCVFVCVCVCVCTCARGCMRACVFARACMCAHLHLEV